MSAALRSEPPWILAGPWYRWTRPGLPADGRTSRPAIQMFSGDDFVQAFLQRPQHSLKADPTIDYVNNFDFVSAAPGGQLAGKIGAMFAVNAAGDPYRPGVDPAPLRARLAPSALRKLFQPSHDRHYLVTCELHCDAPGFPRANRLGVCQAGFVVRRRRSTVPAGVTAGDITGQVAPVRTAEADLLDLLTLAASALDPRASAALVAAVATRQQALASAAGVADWAALLALRQGQLADKRAALDKWFVDMGVSVAIDGWFPTLQDGRPSAMYGSWQPLDAAAQVADVTSGEQTSPMFALVPDPRDTQHDAAGRTMYYGNVPTMSLQHDTDGNARFDDQTTYEVRCFVRRHHACPPKVGKTPDCNGALTWSLATDVFRMAAPFDVVGAANRPITIRMPDLRDLAAQVASRPRGKLSPVRVIQPQHLAPNSDGKGATGGQMGAGSTCSFSIPLITIVAMFVLSLFLPIVVFLFDLWFLLALRFCIPPSLQASAGVDAALAATPPAVDLDIDGAVTVGGTVESALGLNQLLAPAVANRLKGDSDMTVDLGDYSNNALGTLDQSLTDNASLTANADGSLPSAPPVGTPVAYEPTVTSTWSLRTAVTS